MREVVRLAGIESGLAVEEVVADLDDGGHHAEILKPCGKEKQGGLVGGKVYVGGSGEEFPMRVATRRACRSSGRVQSLGPPPMRRILFILGSLRERKPALSRLVKACGWNHQPGW